jgi:hypothetical protein
MKSPFAALLKDPYFIATIAGLAGIAGLLLNKYY